MLAYLAQGWFSSHAPCQPRREVLDGALDSAGVLHQAGIEPSAVTALATTLVRVLPNTTMLGATDPHALLGRISWHSLREHMLWATDHDVTLQTFVMDGLAGVHDFETLEAFCVHLRHVAQNMTLLANLHAATCAPPLAVPGHLAPGTAAVAS